MCGFDHPPPSSTKVNKRVELYIHLPSVPSWHVIVRTSLKTEEGSIRADRRCGRG